MTTNEEYIQKRNKIRNTLIGKKIDQVFIHDSRGIIVDLHLDDGTIVVITPSDSDDLHFIINNEVFVL